MYRNDNWYSGRHVWVRKQCKSRSDCSSKRSQQFRVFLLRRLDPLLYVETPSLKFEPPHDKTNKMACAPSEDSDQPGHLPSLIRVFVVRMKKAWFLSYLLSAQRRLKESFCWFCQRWLILGPLLKYFKFLDFQINGFP